MAILPADHPPHSARLRTSPERVGLHGQRGAGQAGAAVEGHAPPGGHPAQVGPVCPNHSDVAGEAVCGADQDVRREEVFRFQF